MLETRLNTDVDILADKLRDNDIHDYEEVEEEDEVCKACGEIVNEEDENNILGMYSMVINGRPRV